MPDELDTLINVLILEKKKNFNNSSVAGGLKNFIQFLNKPEFAKRIDEISLSKLRKFFLNYSELDLSERSAGVQEILSSIKEATNRDQLTKTYPRVETVGSDSNSIVRGETLIQEPSFFSDIKSIRGIGDRNSKGFYRLGIKNIIDLLRYYPRRYQDFSKLKTINQIEYGEELTIIGSISQDLFIRKSKSGKLSIIETSVNDGTGSLRITWFNKPFLKNQLYKGAPVVVSGKIDIYNGRMVMNSPEWEPLEKEQLHTNRIVPIYPLTAGITQRQLRKIIKQNLDIWGRRYKEYLTKQIIDAEKLPGIADAIHQIHFPESETQLDEAQKRFAFEEIFFLQLGVLIQKRNWVSESARPYSITTEQIHGIEKSLPYELTSAQQKAIKDIFQDLQSGKPMNRLLQGDVGSGKTVVSRFAIEAVVQNGSQAAIMAPTSILAEQHFRSISELMINSGSIQENQIALLIGDTLKKEKGKILKDLSTGEIKVIIGTHALIEDPVNFHDLQLAVIDEQHRFGVHQRKALRVKGKSPHLLVMTATPIPRSLALTVYGDLDVSVIDEMPIGRKPVKTILISPEERNNAYQRIREQIQKGFQAFIIYPLVEIEEEEDFSAAVNEQKRLSAEVFPEVKIGLVHGKLKPQEKEDVMNDFRSGKYKILVSTTVIEVGVDIPNATIVLIEGANRFGLAQLHQIRGRVGRNSDESFCILIPENEDNLENERLSAMTKTNDGFMLADIDLKLRGPGEFLGTRQSGYAQMKFANLTDLELIKRCRNHSKQIFNVDPDLKFFEHQLLLQELRLHWPELE